ncbi:MAG: hypothetical protein IKD63_00065, partial [Oscillospiraceae bacterium]|nr:hypothetical protein [Oscillospiraceae bacterium]
TATLVAVAFQSYSLDKAVKRTGWKQNFRVNGETIGTEHDAFASALAGAIDEIAALGGTGNVRFWITGQSHGGALANLLAAKLPAAAGISGQNIYAYTFETPAVVESSAVQDNESAYGYIHNYLASDDIVTKLPPWGMVRYGKDHEINTDEINAKLPVELQRLGSEMYELTKSEPEAPVETVVSKIMDALVKRAPTRKAYSAVHTDKIETDDGKTVILKYTYQDVLTGLMEVVFGEAFANVDADAITGNMNALFPAAGALVEAVKTESDGNESNGKYYEAAQGLNTFLIEKCGIDLGLSDADMYALVKLLGPVIVDRNYEPETAPTDMIGLLAYYVPLIQLYTLSPQITFAHQFDAVIGRLKALAGMPEMEGFDIRITEPAAGDPVAKATSEVVEFVDSLGNSWLSAEAAWESVEPEGGDAALPDGDSEGGESALPDGESEGGESALPDGDSEGGNAALPDGRVMYLDVTLTGVAHVAAEGFAVTIGGQKPVADPEITYKDGKTTVRATWAFVLGSPARVKVSFDAGGHAEDPAPLEAEVGARLKWAIAPADLGTVTDGGKTWRFDDWVDGDGQSWKTLTAEKDIALSADWTLMIDRIEITYPIPHVGEAPGQPSVSDDADYYLDDIGFSDEDYNEIDAVESTAPLHLEGSVYVKSDKAAFKDVTDEEGFTVFGGTLAVNGEEIEEVSFYDEDGYLDFSYEFTPLPAEQKLPGKTIRGDMFNLAGNVKVTWKAVPGAKYYKVYREGITDPSESVDEPVIVTSRLVGWDKSPGLTDGHKYRYRIVASLTDKGDPSGDSPQSYSKIMYRLKNVAILSAKNTDDGKVTVRFRKTASGDSYVLRWSEREDMSGAKMKVIKGASNTSCVIGGLTKGKTYYFSIRVRKVVDGINYYTTFGVAKKVKVER